MYEVRTIKSQKPGKGSGIKTISCFLLNCSKKYAAEGSKLRYLSHIYAYTMFDRIKREPKICPLKTFENIRCQWTEFLNCIDYPPLNYAHQKNTIQRYTW